MRNVNETQVNSADAKAIFKQAAASRENPSGAGRLFKSLRKDKIDVADLQRAWQQAGYPDDLKDITNILKSHGFGQKEINKVFTATFGKSKSGEPDIPKASEAILKIAEYAKKSGIDQELIKFLQSEFGFKESAEFEGKALIEDVRFIFTQIIGEERKELPTLLRAEEYKYLGRNRK